MCCRRKFRSQTSDNMQRWRSKGVRGPCDNAQSPADLQCGKWFQRRAENWFHYHCRNKECEPCHLRCWFSVYTSALLHQCDDRSWKECNCPPCHNCSAKAFSHVLLSNHESEDGCWDLAPAVEVRQGPSEAELVVRVGEGTLASNAIEVRRWTLWSRRDLALAVEVRRGHPDPELAVGVLREDCDLALAVVVWRGTLSSQASLGPAGNTAIYRLQLRSGGGQSDPELAVGVRQGTLRSSR